MDESAAITRLSELHERAPLSQAEKIQHIYLYLHRRTLAKLLWMNHIYEQIIHLPGIVAEFGVHFGRNLALLESLRGVHEPYNLERRIVGFDNFAGFTNISEKDPNAEFGGLSLPEGYQEYLQDVLDTQTAISPHPEARKIELRAGDATEELEKYLDDNPETIFALAHMDIGLYNPTLKCLQLVRSRVVKGSIICFDQIHNRKWPGDTIALSEVEGLMQSEFQRLPYSGASAFLRI